MNDTDFYALGMGREDDRREREMGRYTQETGGTFTPAPTGTHVARCYSLIDIGTHHGEYQGQPTVRNQVIIGWELPAELMDDGQPYVTSKFYTNSLSEKANLRRDLEAWRGRAFTQTELARFDLQSVLGAPCMISVIANDKGKHVVASVTSMPKGMQCPPAINPQVAFWIDEWDQAVFDSLSEGLQGLIKKSDEYQAREGGEDAAEASSLRTDFDDSIPF